AGAPEAGATGASMGPCRCRHGMRRGPAVVYAMSKPSLQWGRVVADTEWARGYADPTSAARLQWGRVVADTEWTVSYAHKGLVLTLQWGRVVADTECIGERPRNPRRIRFNGAVS